MSITYELKQIPDPAHTHQDEAPVWELIRVFKTGRYYDEETSQWRSLGLRTVVQQSRWDRKEEKLLNRQARRFPWLVKNIIQPDDVIVPVEAKTLDPATNTHKNEIIYIALNSTEITKHHPELL